MLWSGSIIRPSLLSCTTLTAALFGLEARCPGDGLAFSRETHRIHCAGFLSPRSALVEDISPGSSLRESYCKGYGY